MTYERLKKFVVSAALTAAFVLSVGFANSSVASAQYRDRDRFDRDRWDERGRWDQRQEREALRRIRRLDRDHQLRYRFYNRVRVVGYFDRFGRFHAYGFYDRFGRFQPISQMRNARL